jgi:hypothetical protein
MEVILISVIWKAQKWKNFWFESQAVKEHKHLCSNRLWGKYQRNYLAFKIRYKPFIMGWLEDLTIQTNTV